MESLLRSYSQMAVGRIMKRCLSRHIGVVEKWVELLYDSHQDDFSTNEPNCQFLYATPLASCRRLSWEDQELPPSSHQHDSNRYPHYHTKA